LTAKVAAMSDGQSEVRVYELVDNDAVEPNVLEFVKFVFGPDAEVAEE
jgi:hypothetical protein